MIFYFSYAKKENPSTLSCIIRRAGHKAGKPRSVLSEGSIAFVTRIHKDSVRRWNLWFPSAGVFSEVHVGRVTRTQITLLPVDFLLISHNSMELIKITYKNNHTHTHAHNKTQTEHKYARMIVRSK